jgi:hypothetical protein
MKNTVIPKRENRTKRLFIPVTPTEHQRIKEYCTNSQVRLSDFIRFALKQTYEL